VECSSAVLAENIHVLAVEEILNKLIQALRPRHMRPGARVQQPRRQWRSGLTPERES
jgi:hypothetical protein